MDVFDDGCDGLLGRDVAGFALLPQGNVEYLRHGHDEEARTCDYDQDRYHEVRF